MTGGWSCGLRRNHTSCSAQKYIDGGGLTYYSIGDDVGSLVLMSGRDEVARTD